MTVDHNEEFDVIIVGGGPTGEHAADRCSRAGLSTAVVEGELLGGECSYWACMPSKTLLRPSRVLAASRAVPGAREQVRDGIDVEAALARRDWMTADWNDQGQVDWLAGVGGTLIRGHGRLTGEKTLDVDGPEGARHLVARRAVILANGSRAAVPPIPGLAESHFWDNREVTAAKVVPRHLLILGGGVVGVEMAQAWRRLGSGEVVIIEGGPRLIGHGEPFASDLLEQVFAREGITVLTGVRAIAVHRETPAEAITVDLEDGRSLVGDELLVAVGRSPQTNDIGLETVGLVPGKSLVVDDAMHVVDVPGEWLFAIGDVNGRALLTHMGKYQARVAVSSILGTGMNSELGDHAVPGVIFTDPEIASVGLTEREAIDKGLTVRVVRVDLTSVAAAAVNGEGVVGACQIVVDTANDRIVGATFVGPELAEAIHGVTIAIVGGVSMDALRHAVPSFPTFSEVWIELVERYFADA